MTTELRVYRQSAIASASCLKRFHEIYDLGLEDDSDESRRGTAFHHIALEQYIPALLKAGVPKDLALLDRAFRAGIVESRCPPHLVDEVEHLIFSWGARFELLLHAFLLAEERQVSGRVSWKPDLAQAFRHTPRGSLLRITDFKTYYAILNEQAVRAMFQGQFYVHDAMRQWPGFDVYEFAIDFVRYGVQVTVEYTPDDLESLDRKVEATIATIDDARARNDWPAQPGEHCGFCRLVCDKVDDPRMLERRALNSDDAQRAGERAIVLQRELASELAIVRAFTVTGGPVTVGNMEWAHRKVERWRYPAPEVIDVLREAQYPIPAGITVSKSTLRPILATKRTRRANPAMVSAIEDLAMLKTSTRFSVKKAGDVAPDQEDGEE